jgi:hypothetical protein
VEQGTIPQSRAQRGNKHMKFSILLLLSAVFAISFVHAQQAPPEQLVKTQERYQVEFEQLEGAEAAAYAPVVAAYVKDLTRLKEAAQAKGDLKGVLDFDALITAARAGTVDEAGASANASVRTTFANYQRNKVAALRQFVVKRQQLEASYSQAMTALEQQYTRSGQIEAAKQARDAKAMPPGIQAELIASMSGVVLSNEKRANSDKTYKPPIEVEWRFQTDGDVRLSYACGQLIFNWGPPPHELRIDGGPVSGQHKKGEGAIPHDKVVTVKLTVLPKQMTVSVDGRERARWTGDFSAVDQPVSIRAHVRSTVKVEHVIVRKLK